MRSPSPPPPPDPYQVANAQTQQNQDAALYNAQLNRFNTYTPLGSQEFSVTGTDPTTGAPQYRQDINLTPEMQQLLSQQNQQDLALGNVAQGMLGTVGNAYAGRMDTSGLPGLRGNLNVQGPGLQGQVNSQGLPGGQTVNTHGLPDIPTDVGALRQNAQDALYRLNTGYLDPQMQRGEESLRTRLANQGVVEGSEAYRNAFDDFNRSKETAYRMARDQSIAGGGEEAERMFGIGSSARGQLFGERLAGTDQANSLRGQMFGERLAGGQFTNDARSQALAEALAGTSVANSARAQGMDELFALRNQPLNEFNALRSASQVQMPSFQGAAQVGTNPADLAGNIYNSYGGEMDIYNSRMASRNALLQGLFGLGSSAIKAWG